MKREALSESELAVIEFSHYELLSSSKTEIDGDASLSHGMVDGSESVLTPATKSRKGS